MEQLASHLVPGRGKKRQLAELLKEQEERREERGELLPESAIQVVDHAKKRRGKEERLATVMVSKGSVFQLESVCTCQLFVGTGRERR